MIFERVRDIISADLSKKAEDIKENTSLRDELEADSLDIFRVVNDIEDEFNIRIEDAEQFYTVRDVVLFIEENMDLKGINGEKNEI